MEFGPECCVNFQEAAEAEVLVAAAEEVSEGISMSFTKLLKETQF
jgi:hypothetical protein